MLEFLDFLLVHYLFYFYFIPIGLLVVLQYRRIGVKQKKLSLCWKLVILFGGLFFAMGLCLFFTHHFFYHTELIRIMPRPYRVSDMILKLLLGGGISVLFVILLSKCRIVINSVLHSSFLLNNKYGITIFIYLLFTFIVRGAYEIPSDAGTWYTLDYSMGVCSRMLLGTIITFMGGGFVSGKMVFYFLRVNMFILILLISFLLNYVFTRCSEKIKYATGFICIYLLVSPYSITAMWEGIFARLEAINLIISLLTVILFNKIRKTELKYAVLALMSCLSMAVYQGDVFMYYPIILMIIVYDICRNFEWKRLGYAGAAVGITSVVFFYFQLFAKVKYQTVDELILAIESKSDMGYSHRGLKSEFFETLPMTMSEIGNPFKTSSYMPRETTYVYLLILLPFLMIFVALFAKCFSILRQRRVLILARPHIYFLLLNLCIIPQYIVNVDWGRYMIVIHNVLIFGVFYLIFKKDEEMLLAMEALDQKIRKNAFLFVFLLVYAASLDVVKCTLFASEEVFTIMEWLRHSEIFSIP